MHGNRPGSWVLRKNTSMEEKKEAGSNEERELACKPN